MCLGQTAVGTLFLCFRTSSPEGSLLQDLLGHLLDQFIAIFWRILVQLRQGEEILVVSFRAEDVGQQNLMVMVPEPHVDRAAGP